MTNIQFIKWTPMMFTLFKLNLTRCGVTKRNSNRKNNTVKNLCTELLCEHCNELWAVFFLVLAYFTYNN